MKCEALIDYFNGTLNDKDRAAFEKHLAECTDCREELEELRLLTADLPFAAEPAEPNDGMKERVLSAVFAEEPVTAVEKTVTAPAPRKPARQWLQPLLAASLLLSAGANVYLLAQKEETDQQVAREEPATLAGSVQLAATEGFNGQAQASMVQENGHSSVILQANQLQVPSGTEAYQVWLINEAGDKVRAGTFNTDESGRGAVSYTMPADDNWQMIAVTLEPTATSEQPLGDIVLAAEL